MELYSEEEQRLGQPWCLQARNAL